MTEKELIVYLGRRCNEHHADDTATHAEMSDVLSEICGRLGAIERSLMLERADMYLIMAHLGIERQA